MVLGRMIFYVTLIAFAVNRGWLGDDVSYNPSPLTLVGGTIWLAVFTASSMLTAWKTPHQLEKLIMGWLSFALIMIGLGLWWARVEMDHLVQWGLFAGFVAGMLWVCTHDPGDHAHSPRPRPRPH